jgi:hypothetical protein
MLIGKYGGKRQYGRHKYRWKDDVNIYLNEIGLEGVEWIHLADYMV